MGWWSLGPEDEEPKELRPQRSTRRARGGAGRVPVSSRGGKEARKTRSRTRSPEKSKKRKSSPKKKRLRVVGGPMNEEPTLFASIGRMLNSNSNRRAASDMSTVGTAKYPGQDGIPVKASNNANEAQRRANEMANAMAWLTIPAAATAQDQEQTGADLFGDTDNWWESNSTHTEDMPDLMALLMLGQTPNDDNDVVANESNKYAMNGKELFAEKQAKEFEGSLQWLHNNRNKYDEEEIDFVPETFQKVDALFEEWMPKAVPSLEWERYDPREDPREAERLTKDLKKSLALILSGDAFDNGHPNIPIIRQLKNIFADWKLKEDDTVEELENALRWWKLNASIYDPSTATDEDTDMFMLLKKIFGLNEGDTWDEWGKEMKEVLRLWSTHKNDSMEACDEDTLEKLKQVKDSFLQIKRDELSANDMKHMAKEMDEVLSWYLKRGYKIEDLSKVKNTSKSKFKKVQSLLSLWGRHPELSVDRLKEIVKFMVVVGRNNSSSDVLENYNGEIGVEFRKLQETMMNWRLKGVEADAIVTAKGNSLSRDIAGVLDWWVKNGEAFNFNTANQENIFMAQMSRSILDIWMQCESENAFNFQDLTLAVNEIKKFLALYRDTFEKPEILQELAISWENKKEGLPEAIAKDIESAISWWRSNNTDGDELENPTISHHLKKVEKLISVIRQCTGIKSQDEDSIEVSWIRKGVLQDTSDDFESHKVANSKSEFSFVAAANLSEEEKKAKAMSSALDWLRTNDAILDIDDDMSIALSVATFKKIDALMPETKDCDAPTTMGSALDWLRLQTDVDDVTVSSFKKIDNVLTQSGAFDSIKQGGFQGALDWLRKRQTETAASNAGGESTSRNDTTHLGVGPGMPKSEEEKRAEQMTCALDWLRNNNGTEEASIGSGLGSLGSGLGSVGAFRKIGVNDEPSTSLSAFDWSRSKATNMDYKLDDDVKDRDDADDLFISTTVRPKPKEVKKAKEMSDALASLKKNGAEFAEKDSPNLSSDAFKVDDFVPVFQETTDKERNDSLNWIPGVHAHFDDSTITKFKRLDAFLPSREGLTQETCTRKMESALNSYVEVNEKDFAFDSCGPLSHKTSAVQSLESRYAARNNALNWFRARPCDMDDSSGEFTRVDQLLPKKKGQKPKDRAREIEGALDWRRNSDVLPENAAGSTPALEALSSVPISKRTPEERMKDVDDVMTWLRNAQDASLDPTGEFTRVNQMLPKKEGQKFKDRAREIEGALDWMRNNGIKPSDNVPAGSFEKLGSVPISRRTPEQRKGEIDRVMNWLRKGKSESDDPSGEFTRIDQLLPKKKGYFDCPTMGVDCMKKTKILRSKEAHDSFHAEALNFSWMLPLDDLKELRDDVVEHSRLGDINWIPRDDPPFEGNHSDIDWARNTTEFLPDFFGFERGDLFGSIPASREDRVQPENNCLDWIRYPRTESQFEEEKLDFDQPSTVHSIPRVGPTMTQETPEADWSRHPSKKNPAVADDDFSFDRSDSLNSVRKSKLCSDGHTNEDQVDWTRNPSTFNVQDEIDVPFSRPGDIRSIPRDRVPMPANDPELEWARSLPEDEFEEVLPFERPPPLKRVSRSKILDEDDTKGDTARSVVPDFTPAEEKILFDLPGDLRSIARSDKPRDSKNAELGWSRSKGKLVAGVPEEDDVFDRPGVCEIPRDGIFEADDNISVAQSWARNPSDIPSNPIPGKGNVFYRPENIRSLPRAGKLHEAGGYATLSWNRNPAWKNYGTRDEENVFDHPGDLITNPRIGRSNDDIGEISSAQNPGTMSLASIPGQENVYDRPGDIRSIPRGVKPQEGYPELSWERNPAWKNQGTQDEENVFDRPGSLRSIPHIRLVNDEDRPTLTWGRNLASKEHGYDEDDNGFDRPGNLRFIPRDGRLNSSNDTEFTWARQASFESIVGFPEETEDDLSEDFRVIPRDERPNESDEWEWSGPQSNWMATRPHDAMWTKEKPNVGLEDLRAIPRDGRPNEIDEWERSGPKPNWMVTRPDDAMWTKEDPYFDWSGARPFDRPENTVVTSLDDTQPDPDFLVPDDLTEFTEIVEDKPQPVKGVPCAAWTMLALGAAAGGAMTSGSAPQGAAVASQFANNQSVSTTTGTFYPDAGLLPNCSTDANCQIVMDGLSPILPPDVLGLFDLPGTCQSKARDWLRTGKDILQFKAERIRQRYAMSVFFCEMDGGDWIQGDSWLSDLHECDWYNKIGLDPCNREEQVEMLRVTDNGLTGTLPVEMFILSNLYEFTLANNLVSGTLPQLFDHFKELDTLVIPFNQFEGSFPHQIWEYPDMVYLDIAYNGFIGTIPPDIDTKMPNLQVAFLENNKLSGPIPESLGNLRKLRLLHLDDNKFTGTIPETLGLPARMSELLLHDNLLTGQVPKQLGDLKRLQLLTLHYNSFDEQTIDENICDLIYSEQLELATVDKATVNCGCCSPGEESFV